LAIRVSMLSAGRSVRLEGGAPLRRATQPV
jgi:hypothetical protein